MARAAGPRFMEMNLSRGVRKPMETWSPSFRFPDAASVPRGLRTWVTGLSICLLLVSALRADVARDPAGKPSPKMVSFGKLPLYFEPNRGQADTQFQFLSRGSGCEFLLGANKALIALRKPGQAGTNSRDAIPTTTTGETLKLKLIRLELIGANAQARLTGLEPLPGKVNYFIGNDPSQWQEDVPTFSKVQCEEVYPGVTLVYYGNQEQLEYDFILAPGADPAALTLRFEGVDRLEIDTKGDLVLHAGAEQVRQHKPVVHQTVRGARREADGRYWLKDHRTVGFRLGRYDTNSPLVIDPVLSYSTYLGGASRETAWDIAIDAEGNAYIAGETMSTLTDYVTPGAYQIKYGGGTTVGGDAFVAKLNASGSAFIYFTYLGGKGNDGALSLALDNDGNAYLTGFTDSTNFPTVGAIQTSIGGETNQFIPIRPFDAFVAKLNSTGSALLYSTYLGGEDVDEGTGIAVDPVGNAYVAGFTGSTNFFAAVTNFPGAARLQMTNAGVYDAFVTKLSPDGRSALYSTFVGGANTDIANDIAVDDAGNAYLTGFTTSADFPTTNALQYILYGRTNVFVSKIDASGSNFVYSSYLGGTGNDIGYSIALDSSGFTYVTGSKTSSNFLTTPHVDNNGGIFKSSDAGMNWSPRSIVLPHNVVSALAVDRGDPSTLYAGTGLGVARTTNGGALWQPLVLILNVSSIALDPVNPANVYVGGLEGLFYTTNAGADWFLLNALPATDVAALAVDPTATATLYVGALLHGVFKTTNAGANWSQLNSGLGNLNVRQLVLHPSAPATLYAATDGGVYRSTNSGARWLAANTGLSSVRVRALVIDPVTPSLLYAGTDGGGVFRSTNGGLNWSVATNGLGSRKISALAIDPSAPSTLYAGGTNGIFKTVNGGSSWTSDSLGLTTPGVASLAVDPSSSDTVYAGTSGTNSFGSGDVFLAKFFPGDVLAPFYSVGFGGKRNDVGWAVAADDAGNAYVTGATSSTNFPVAQTTTLKQAKNSGRMDAFVTRFNATASEISYSFYLGGRGDDFGSSIGVDPAGNAYVVGLTASTDFPTNDAIQAIFAGGGNDIFVTKVLSVPALRVAPQADRILVTWRAPSPEFVLEGSESPGAAARWAPMAVAPVVVDGWHTVSLPASDPCRFFRLRLR